VDDFGMTCHFYGWRGEETAIRKLAPGIGRMMLRIAVSSPSFLPKDNVIPSVSEGSHGSSILSLCLPFIISYIVNEPNDLTFLIQMPFNIYFQLIILYVVRTVNNCDERLGRQPGIRV
jgi:hypothetical protein